MTENKITSKLTFVAGALIRRSVVSKVKNIAFCYNIDCKVDEDKGFLDSNYRVTLTGPATEVASAKRVIHMYFKELA